MQMKVPFKENVCLVCDGDTNVAYLLANCIMFLTQLFSSRMALLGQLGHFNTGRACLSQLVVF